MLKNTNISVIAIKLIALYLVISFTNIIGTACSARPLSVPAEFVRELQVPGKANQILRPSALFVDRQFREIYVADPGHNRIAIFDSNGVFRYEFGGGNQFSSPVDLSVDEQGYIWILGSSQSGRGLYVFDFDGQFVSKMVIPTELDGIPVSVNNFDIDSEGKVYLLDGTGLRVLIYYNSSLISSFNILTQMDSLTRREQVLGKLLVWNDLIFIPSGTIGSVLIYDFNGKQTGRIGNKGNQPGRLNFPVAVALTSDSTVLILDKHRYNVVCFDFDGKFKGEFGGKGVNPGWFYHPSLLDIDNDNLVYVGQIFDNKIQACRIPEFICPNKTDRVQE